METYIQPEDHGEWFNFKLPVPGGSIPVRVTREAMEDHCGADDQPMGLLAACARHDDLIHETARRRMVPGAVYTRENPLVLRTADF